ncbi:NAD-dependent epimerase/dehydratase family protein [Noviherbaspirillum aerium]|uniref:NAD-dependent epimerase/dehydratase family protein n=1 Tax=Noviherbaspirillum aerium TaxID=2588497 RepID=UPI00124E79E7|nr:NAD(P)-dependent oxidoreductase [Noviherbaspirillum aerium]
MFNRLLITGAAGNVGKVMRERLAPFARILRLSDVKPFGPEKPNEEHMLCDLGDMAGVHQLLKDCDAIVHLGGISVEAPFQPILNANIVGVYNLYEAARKHGIGRIVFASSNHVIGFYEQNQTIDTEVPMRPDTMYGVSKGFGELLSRFYFDRYGIETVCLRIGSAYHEPLDRRMMSTFLSFDDLTELIRCSLYTENVGHTVVYGVSANRNCWWDNSKARHLGFQPKDTSEVFRAKIDAAPPVDRADPMMVFQGGRFVIQGPFEEECGLQG